MAGALWREKLFRQLDVDINAALQKKTSKNARNKFT